MADWDAWLGAALPLVAGGLVVVAAVRAPGAAHARVGREGGTAFLNERLMHHGYAWIELLAAAACRLGLSANAVSWLSLGLGLAAGLAAGRGAFGLSAWLLALSGLGDGMDGAMARRQGTAGVAGAVLDSALDRYVEFFFLAGLVWHFRGEPVAQLLTLTALVGGFMVTYSTARAEALRLTPPRAWMKRPERMVWLAGGAAAAAAARWFDVRGELVIISVLVVIAVFAHAAAVVRLRAVARGPEPGRNRDR